MTTPENPVDIDALWEYSDPSVSEGRFRLALARSDGDFQLELLTQIARTFSLRGRYAEAHAILDDLAARIATAGSRPRTRYLLERGRTLNSNGEKELARPLFVEAWELAQASGLTGLAVDAAHMLAIVASGTPEAVTWNERGLQLARQSEDPKARSLIPAMLNNGAWDLHLMGRYEQALSLFEEAQAEWQKTGRPDQIRIARWSVARCLRSLRRYEEALTIQRSLESEQAQAGTEDGYVFEEIAENLAALGEADDAKSFFRRAHETLSKDAWLTENEPDRLAQLKVRAGG